MSGSQQQQKLKCGTCGATFLTTRQFLNHQRTQSQELPFICCKCGEKFQSTAILNNHLNTHSDERPYICPTCGNKFKDNSALLQHVRKYHEEGTHSCHLCPKKFKGPKGLSTHMKTHTGQTSHKCQVCFRSYVTKKFLNDHIRRCHRTYPTGQQESDSPNRSEHADEGTFECPHCGAIFKSLTALNDHLARAHTRRDENLDENSTREEGDTVIFLKTVFEPNLSLQEEYSFQCVACGLVFDTEAEVTLHNEIAHEMDEIEFQCPICNETFRGLNDLGSHFSDNHQDDQSVQQEESTGSKELTGFEHEEESQFVCQLCNEGFSNLAELDTHRKEKHQRDELVFKMRLLKCGEKFNRASDLSRHNRHKHEGDERKTSDIQEDTGSEQKEEFVCPICKKSFSNDTEFNVHLMIVHENITCSKCGEKFTFQVDFDHHRNWCKPPTNVQSSHSEDDKGSKPKEESSYVQMERRSDQDSAHEDMCQICDEGFNTQAELNAHNKEKHPVQVFKCEKCGETFRTQSELNRHERHKRCKTDQNVQEGKRKRDEDRDEDGGLGRKKSARLEIILQKTRK